MFIFTLFFKYIQLLLKNKILSCLILKILTQKSYENKYKSYI